MSARSQTLNRTLLDLTPHCGDAGALIQHRDRAWGNCEQISIFEISIFGMPYLSVSVTARGDLALVSSRSRALPRPFGRGRSIIWLSGHTSRASP
jgi:hypothetical protein